MDTFIQPLLHDQKENTKTSSRKRGFTFIELIITISILGILVLVASSNYNAYLESARYVQIRNDIMLAEGVVGEQLLLGEVNFNQWKMVEPDDIEPLLFEDIVFDKDGLTRSVQTVYYQEFPKDFVRQAIPSELEGVFVMGANGQVLYIDKDVELPAYIPPRVITPEMEIVEGGGWRYEDFSYEGNALTGLSQVGEERFNSGHNNLILPDRNPYNDTDIELILPGAFRHYQFQGEISGETIEEIGDNAFRRANFSGDFYMPNIRHIDESSFRDSYFVGSFVAPKLLTIAPNAFRTSEFEEYFSAPSIEWIGGDAFRHSRFVGDFHAPSLLSIGVDAFLESPFDGDYYAPSLEHMGNNAFGSQQFSSGF